MRIKEIYGLCKSGSSTRTLKKLLCGKYIGSGQFRDVYLLKDNPRYVVKIDKGDELAAFPNVTEWRNFVNYESYKPIGRWLAPCIAINKSGSILIQARVTKAKKYPRRIPACFIDTKKENFGIYKGRFVCHDYSFLSFKQVSLDLEQVEWWSIKDVEKTEIYIT